MTRDIREFDDGTAVARAFADFLVGFTTDRPKTTIALSGGSTPKILFKLLADEYSDAIDWSGLHFFWGDERCVPPSDADSNYGMTQSLLFDHVPVNEDNIHRVLGENNPINEAVRYGKVLEKVCDIRNGLPSVDLMILGMGDDGHTASIFPHQMELLQSEAICAVADHPTSGQKRITITGPCLNNSDTVAFLVTGQNKAEKVRMVLNSADNLSPFPAAHITGFNQIWFLDKAASSMM